MKLATLALLGSATLAAAQLPAHPTPDIARNTDGTFTLDWTGQPGITYFIQYSLDLQTWSYMPAIESGNGSAIGYGFDSNSDRMFLRLHYTDQPTSNPNSDDFDGDGISNWDEVRTGGTGTSPLKWDTDGDGQSDYFSDSDANGTADGWEIKHFGAVGVVDPLADDDQDGLNNADESHLDTDPDAHADENDEDGDGLEDAVDAVPDDPLINWPTTPKTGYVYLELDEIPGMEDVTAIALSEAGHVLVKAWPAGMPRNGPNQQFFVWQPVTSAWSGALSKSYNGDEAGWISASDVDADGRIIGTASVVTDIQNVYGEPAVAHYHAAIQWTGAAADPYPAAGDRFGTSPNGFSIQTYARPPIFAPDGEMLSMDRGAYVSYSNGVLIEHQPSVMKMGGNELDHYLVEESEPPESYGITNHFGKPGSGNLVTMTRVEGYFDIEGGDPDYKETGIYLFQNGNRETVDSVEWVRANAVAAMPDQDGVEGNGRLAVTGTYTWIKKDGTWQRTKRRISGERITSSGIILTDRSDNSRDLWMNGKHYLLEEFCPSITEKNYQSLYIKELSDSGIMLIQAVAENGDQKVGVALPISFKEFAPNTGFDNYERFLKEQRLERPWLAVPETNQVIMHRNPGGMKVAMNTKFDPGKNSTVDPVESAQSPETLTVTGNGPWAQGENSYEGTLQVQQVDALNLVVYKRRELTLAVHAVTLINDDVDSGIKMGEGKPNTICISRGQGQGILWTTQTGGDDTTDGVAVYTGPNGICETSKTDNRDEQVIPEGKGEPFAVIVQPGQNGILNTAVNDSGKINEVNGVVVDDDTVAGETITTGADGIRETSLVKAAQAPVNVPTKAQLQETLDRIFGKQANIYFDVKYVNHVDVAYDVGDEGGNNPEFAAMANPNGRLDFFTNDTLSPEELLLRSAAHDSNVDFNLYYIGSGLSKFTIIGDIKFPKPEWLLGFARTSHKTPYVCAFDQLAVPITNQTPTNALAGSAAHELAHNHLFRERTGLRHPRVQAKVNGVTKYVPDKPENSFTLNKEADDRLRLMWPDYTDGGVFPEMLLKDECDRLHGITEWN